MAADVELMMDRRSLRRRLTGWRVIAFVAGLIAIVLGGLWLGGERVPTSQQVARVSLSGMITGGRPTLDLLKEVGESQSVKAVLIAIDSPGGTVTGSEDIYDAIRAVSAKKPTVAVINSMGASGAYIAALGTDRIFARQTSLVGSIGVLIQFPNFAGLLDKVGVQVKEVKSSPLKAAPNAFDPPTPEAMAAIASVVNDSYAWFKGLVQSRRAMNDSRLASVADGRIFTGRQAVELQLIDQLGAEKDAIKWLEANMGLAANLPVREWKRKQDRSFGLSSAASALAGALGLEQLSAVLQQYHNRAEAAQMEGLLAIWTGHGAQ